MIKNIAIAVNQPKVLP